MPTEDDLRDMFDAERAASSPSPYGIDTKRVIAKSRARRLPRQIAIGAVSTLAVAGIVVVSLPVLLPQQSAVSTLSEGGDAAAPSAQAFDTMKRAPADKVNLCTGTVAEAAPSFYGLQLDVTFPAAASVGTDPVQGTVQLTNTSAVAVTGTTAPSPAITVSQGGIVLWHSNGPASDLTVAVNLAPGQSLEYPATFTPVRCDVQDDEAESFRADLPALPAGGYELSAAIDFLPGASLAQQSTPGLDLVTGPRSPITLQ
jgi:hypothetical protein